MGVRRQAREAALQSLFMVDFLSSWEVTSADFCFDHFEVQPSPREYAQNLCYGVIKNLSKIDSEITLASENWSVSRMCRVDRAIIRIATYEMLFLDEIPNNVAINEAIEVAKRFGTDESPTFVNGVLDKISHNNKPKIEVEKIAVVADDTGVPPVEMIPELMLIKG